MDSFSLMNPTNPLSPLNPVSPISMWDDDDPVRQVVSRGTEAACNSGGCESIFIAFVIVVVVAVAIGIGYRIINS